MTRDEAYGCGYLSGFAAFGSEDSKIPEIVQNGALRGEFRRGFRDGKADARLGTRKAGAGLSGAVEAQGDHAGEGELPDRSTGNGSGGGGPRRPMHPFIEGLLQTLPEPGTVWAIEGRAAWLQAAAQNFTLIYKGDGRIDVHAVPAQKGEKAA